MFGHQEIKALFVLLATGIVDESPAYSGSKRPLRRARFATARYCDGMRLSISESVFGAWRRRVEQGAYIFEQRRHA